MGSGSKANNDVMCENGVWKRVHEPQDDKENWRFFGQTLLDCIKEVSEKVAQIDGVTGEEDTYGSILDRAVRCAIWLRKQNIKSGDFIGICTHYHLDTIVPVLAAIFNGITFHPWWNMALDDDVIKYFLKLDEPKIMFVNKVTAEAIRKGINDLGMDTKIILLENVSGEISLRDILKEQEPEEVFNFQCKKIEHMNQPGIMLNTSGTTGYPKGVLHSYDWFDKHTYIPENYLTNSVMFWSARICWIIAITSTISLIRNAATVIIYPDSNAKIIGQLIKKYNINVLSIAVVHANQFYKDKDCTDYDFSSVKYVYYTGANVTEQVDQHMQAIFHNAAVCFAYGCTEFGGLLCRDGSTEKFCYCGKVQNYCQIKVINVDDGRILGVKEEGEICVKSRYRLLGYYKDPESTEKAFDADGWFHTGDLGYYDVDGDFFIVDRIKELIRYRVIPIVPSIIERFILKHPDVTEVGVVPKPNLVDVEQPMAFITIRSGSKVTEKDIIKYVEDNLPDHLRLRGGVKILEKFPVTPSGKIGKKSLRQMAKNLAETEFNEY